MQSDDPAGRKPASPRRLRRLRRNLGAVAVCLALMAIASPAFAAGGNPSDAQYGSTAHQILGGSNGQGGGPNANGSNGNGGQVAGPSAGPSSTGPLSDRLVSGLPFSGLDLLVLMAAALGLGATGLTLRRFARREETAEAHTH